MENESSQCSVGQPAVHSEACSIKRSKSMMADVEKRAELNNPNSTSVSTDMLYVIFNETRIILFAFLDASTSVFVDYDKDILRFCGQGNNRRMPEFGLTIESINKDDSSVISNEVVDKLRLSYMLQFIFEGMSIDSLIGMCTCRKYPNSPNKSTYGSLVDKWCFAKRVIDLVYDITLTLQSEVPSYVTYFIGEYNEELIEQCGYKVMRGTILEGVLKTEKQEQLTLEMKGKTYCGETKKGRPEGECCVTFSSSSLFCGFSQKGKMTFGCYGQNSTSCALSCWSGRNRNGICMECYGNGLFYFGYYENGKKSGKGLILQENGSITLGTWQNNLVHGLALSLSFLPTIYHGELSGQCFKGYGEMYYRNRSYYYGCWDGGQYHDTGTICLFSLDGKMQQMRSTWNHGQNLCAIVQYHGTMVKGRDARGMLSHAEPC